MSSDEMLSQAKIDAPVSKVPQEPGPSPVTNDVAPANKPSESSSPSAQPESDSLPARLARLESDFAIVKKELQAILLDLREKLLESENPFNAPAEYSSHPANTSQTETRKE
jgi:hypothetical protein